MTVDGRRIAVLGAGKIGEALISGLLSGWRTTDDIVASGRREERVAELHERHGIRTTLSNEEAASGAALVVLSVKPQDLEALLGEIGPVITTEQTVPDRRGDPHVADRTPPVGRGARLPRDAEHTVDRARRHRRSSAPAPTRATQM